MVTASSQSNGTEPQEKPHTLEEYAVDHFRSVFLSLVVSLQFFPLVFFVEKIIDLYLLHGTRISSTMLVRESRFNCFLER